MRSSYASVNSVQQKSPPMPAIYGIYAITGKENCFQTKQWLKPGGRRPCKPQTFEQAGESSFKIDFDTDLLYTRRRSYRYNWKIQELNKMFATSSARNTFGCILPCWRQFPIRNPKQPSRRVVYTAVVARCNYVSNFATMSIHPKPSGATLIWTRVIIRIQ